VGLTNNRTERPVQPSGYLFSGLVRPELLEQFDFGSPPVALLFLSEAKPARRSTPNPDFLTPDSQFQTPNLPSLSCPRPSFHQRPIIDNPYNPQTLFILTPRHSRSLPVTTSRCTIITKSMNIVMINPARPKTVSLFPRFPDFFTELESLFARFSKKSRVFHIFHPPFYLPRSPTTTN